MFAAGARRSYLDNLADMIERCDLKVEDFAAAPHAAAEAVLLEDEKELGVVLIDIGASATGYAVYDNGALVECGGVAVGAGHITRDIAQIFGAPLAHAERVKTLYGSALMGPGDEHRFIDFPQLGVAGETARASRADICEVILPRLEEIFELVSQQLPDDGMRRSGLRRVVLTGGGSLLVGAREVAERTLGMKSRLGRPAAFPGSPEAASAPGFAVCAGLIQHCANSGREGETGLGLLRQSAHAGRKLAEKKSSVFGGVESWLRAKF
jgi:cell division protein FtsA